jgi:hypothetical protein
VSHSIVKNGHTMAKIDLMFGLILLWCIASTSLLVMHHNRVGDKEAISKITYKTMKRKSLAQDGETKRVRKGKRAANERIDHKLDFSSSKISEPHHMKLRQEGQYNTNKESNEFPFTRSFRSFKTPENFFIYAVNAPSSDNSSLEWSEIPWKQLVNNWGPSTTFDDIITYGSLLEQTDSQPALSKKLVIHCLPKTASTTLRDACNKLLDEKCPDGPKSHDHDPYGYRNPTEFHHVVRTCTEVHQFCVQGGDLSTTNVIGYSGKTGDLVWELEKEEEKNTDPMHFVHLVPFRNFNEWAASALKQIYEVDGKCDRIEEMLEQCLGYRELYFELYTKSVLVGLIGRSLNDNASNEDNPWRKHNHHIVLYNYQDTSTIVTDVSNFFNIEPMPHTSKDLKGTRKEGTCPTDVLNAFHKCHDDTLIGMDAIRDFELETEKQKKKHRAMLKILSDHRKSEGWVPKTQRSKTGKRKPNGDNDNYEQGSNQDGSNEY